MADEDFAASISGPIGLEALTAGAINPADAWMWIQVDGVDYKIAGDVMRAFLGEIAFATSGDVSGSGVIGDFTLSIGAGKVTLTKLANLAAKSIIGNNQASAATPRALALSADDFVFVGDTLHTVAAAGASRAAAVHDYERFPGL